MTPWRTWRTLPVGATLLVLALLGASSATAAESEPTTPVEPPTSEPSPVDPEPSSPPDPTPAPADDEPFTVEDAQLRWGINDESNNQAFAPGTYNFFSAGEVPDPGRGGQTVRNGRWTSTDAVAWWARRGTVRVEKLNARGGYDLATFAGLSTQPDGSQLAGPTGGRFSGHQVVLDGGTGQVDPGAGTATIRWSGAFSVLYYSGMTVFTVTDPRLSVTSTSATLRATLSGYSSSMDDLSQWRPVPDRDVVLADLPRASLSLKSAGGFSVTPAYLKVTHDAPANGVSQVRSGASWGAFPPTFLQFMNTVGSAAYWYSSGGSADAYKVARPLTISYSASDPVRPPAQPPTGSNTTPDSPTAPVAPAPPLRPSGPVIPPGSSVSTAAAGPLAAGTAAGSLTDLAPRLPEVPVLYAVTSAAPASNRKSTPSANRGASAIERALPYLPQRTRGFPLTIERATPGIGTGRVARMMPNGMLFRLDGGHGVLFRLGRCGALRTSSAHPIVRHTASSSFRSGRSTTAEADKMLFRSAGVRRALSMGGWGALGVSSAESIVRHTG